MIIYNDFLINFDLGFDKSILCHSNLDFSISQNGDIQLTRSLTESILQKVWIWLSIKEGEVPNDATLGCCIYPFFFKKATPNNFAILERQLEAQLTGWIPELGVKSVSCQGAAGSEGRIENLIINIITKNYGKFDLKIAKGDLEQLNEYVNQLTNVMDFIEQNNQ
jgi:hypothetical protein